jgi:hypothetical protein
MACVIERVASSYRTAEVSKWQCAPGRSAQCAAAP